MIRPLVLSLVLILAGAPVASALCSTCDAVGTASSRCHSESGAFGMALNGDDACKAPAAISSTAVREEERRELRVQSATAASAHSVPRPITTPLVADNATRQSRFAPPITTALRL